MAKVKLNFIATDQEFEVANMMLGQMIELLKENPGIMKQLQLTKNDLKKGEIFRKRMLESFLTI